MVAARFGNRTVAKPWDDPSSIGSKSRSRHRFWGLGALKAMRDSPIEHSPAQGEKDFYYPRRSEQFLGPRASVRFSNHDPRRRGFLVEFFLWDHLNRRPDHYQICEVDLTADSPVDGYKEFAIGMFPKCFQPNSTEP